jgi:hypothetical protein
MRRSVRVRLCWDACGERTGETQEVAAAGIRTTAPRQVLMPTMCNSPLRPLPRETTSPSDSRRLPPFNLTLGRSARSNKRTSS